MAWLQSIRTAGSRWLWMARCVLGGAGRDRSHVRVFSGGRQDWLGGPAVKLNRLQEYFPHEPYAFNLIYTVGATVPPEICRWAQRRGVKIVCHINSMYHPLYAPDYELRNRGLREIHALADHIVYGSRLARNMAERFLGKPHSPHTIAYNAIDIEHFLPVSRAPDGRFNVMAAGVHRARHRLEPLVRAMPSVIRKYPGARLLIAGSLVPGEGIFDCRPDLVRSFIRDVGLTAVEILGEYSQSDAPSVYAQADVLVHIRHLDWTPNTVIEAMACGLPVVHSGTGGLPELVGDAGVSLGLPNDWDRIHMPDPEFLAAKIIEAYERRKELGEASRQRAVEMFDIRKWAEAHRRIFEELLGHGIDYVYNKVYSQPRRSRP